MKRNAGLTLVELLVVIGICTMGVLSSFTAMVRLREFCFLEGEARQTVSELRKTQGLAMVQGESMRVGKFAFSRSGAALPGGSGTQVIGGKKKVILSSAGRVRIE